MQDRQSAKSLFADNPSLATPRHQGIKRPSYLVNQKVYETSRGRQPACQRQ
jgi:hypothetical protein